jgi:CRISPR/Cas system-associated endonuclease Cas1
MPKSNILQIYLNQKHKNKIRLENNNIVHEILDDNDKPIRRQKQSLETFQILFLIGNTTLSTPLIDKLTEHNIPIYLLNYNFQCRSVITNSIQTNKYQIKYKQYQLHDNHNANLDVAKYFLKSKIHSQLNSLKTPN